MYRIKEDSIIELEIKKSKFITYLHRCSSEEDAKTLLTNIKKQHPFANHHCYAFILSNQIQRSNDDKEPSGTAGVPMLEALKKHQVEDILAVCVRYFGGIKLGTGGLIRAYGSCVSHSLEHSELVEMKPLLKCHLSIAYPFLGKIEYLFQKQQVIVQEKLYKEQVHFTFLSKDDLRIPLQEITSNQMQYRIEEEEVLVEVDVQS